MKAMLKEILLTSLVSILGLSLVCVIIAVSVVVGLMIGGTDTGGWIVTTFTAAALSGAIAGLLGFLSGED